MLKVRQFAVPISASLAIVMLVVAADAQPYGPGMRGSGFRHKLDLDQCDAPVFAHLET